MCDEEKTEIVWAVRIYDVGNDQALCQPCCCALRARYLVEGSMCWGEAGRGLCLALSVFSAGMPIRGVLQICFWF